MAIPSLIVADDAAYALELLAVEKPMGVALGTAGFLQPFLDRDSENLIIGFTIPESGSWGDFEVYHGFLRTDPDVVLIDWSLFQGPLSEWSKLVDILKLALETGHTVAVIVRDAATDELELPAHVIEFLLGETPEIYHSEF